MYLFYCLLLLAFVYTLPALAIFPRLVLSSRYAFAIPIVSVGFVYLIVTLLSWLALYTSVYVTAICLSLGLIAGVRVSQLIRKEQWSWPVTDRLVYGFNVLLMLPYFVKLGTESFERGDEIYSWNFWALQHLFHETLDFSHTSATYPQLFPKLLSFCYALLGNIQLQCPVKAMLGIFPLCMLMAWSSVLTPFNSKRVALYLIGILYVVAGLKLEQFFNDGYADPLMTSALVVSMALFLHAFVLTEKHKIIIFSKINIIAFSVIAAFVAMASKQPALMWCGVILPLLIFIESFKSKNVTWIVLGLASIALAAVWILTEGAQFYNNQGVMYLSFEGRGYIEQFFHVFYRYLIKNPLLLVFFVLTGYLLKTRQTRMIFYCFILPQTLLWLIFGAYQLRLGQHVIAASTLLVFASLRGEHSVWLVNLANFLKQKRKVVIPSMVTLSFVACTVLFLKATLHDKPNIRFVDGGRVSLERYFKKDAQKVYDEIYLNDQALLWVPTRYLYGIFYKHTQLTSPAYGQYKPYDVRALIAELREKQPDYVFTVSEEVIDGPASRTLASLVKSCPNSFEVFARPPNKFNYTTYQVNKNVLIHDECLTQLASHDSF